MHHLKFHIRTYPNWTTKSYLNIFYLNNVTMLVSFRAPRVLIRIFQFAATLKSFVTLLCRRHCKTSSSRIGCFWCFAMPIFYPFISYYIYCRLFYFGDCLQSFRRFQSAFQPYSITYTAEQFRLIRFNKVLCRLLSSIAAQQFPNGPKSDVRFSGLR